MEVFSLKVRIFVRFFFTRVFEEKKYKRKKFKQGKESGNIQHFNKKDILNTDIEMLIKLLFDYLIVCIKESEQETVGSTRKVYTSKTHFHLNINCNQFFFEVPPFVY